MSDKALTKQTEQLPVQTEMSLMERLARDPSIDIAKLTSIVELQERMEAKKAEAEWNAAMARAQANIAPIVKNTLNTHTKKKYADLAAICEAILPVASSEGLAISTDTVESPITGHLRIVQLVNHAQGFSRSYHIDLPYDGKGSQGGQIAMNPIQAIGSTVSYGRRYLLLMAFGASSEDSDTDGVLPIIDPDTLSNLISAIESSSSIEALKTAFSNAHKAGTDAKDKAALDTIIKAYEAAKIRLTKAADGKHPEPETKPLSSLGKATINLK